MSGDLIVDPDFLRDMLDLHHIHEPAVTTLFKPFVVSKATKKQTIATQDFIGLVEGEQGEPTRFVFSKPMSTVTDTLGIRKSLLRRYLYSHTRTHARTLNLCAYVDRSIDCCRYRYPDLTLYTNLLDAHFYVFSHWVLELLGDLQAPKSIKSGLIPKLLQLQQNDPGMLIVAHTHSLRALAISLLTLRHHCGQ
jgi:translation initiation factor eIF-2B subunit gamma